MTNEPAQLQALGALPLLAVPLLYLLGALGQRGHGRSLAAEWRWAGACATAAVACAVLAVAWLVGQGAAVFHGPGLISLGGIGDVRISARLDPLTAGMLLLVGFIGWVIVSYSRRYLDGDPGGRRYVRWLMATLASVTLLVISNNLALLALAWLGTSLALHQLLTFYDERPQAMIAAHKKFLISRVADLCLLGAVVLVGSTLGTLEIDEALARAQALPQLPVALQSAAVLLACGAMLKCAQLPVHGWLIQVMEAPTPVSALLHAGVVNLGGFLLIRMSPLIAAVPAAETALVVVGSVTAVVAALVMTTRVSVKVMLAWSTCAQMGLMLVQCGLGAYELALLHLIGHSLYKAHAFLSAGGAVDQSRLQRMTPAQSPVRVGAQWLGAAAGIATVVTAALLFGTALTETPSLWAPALIASLALTPLLTPRALRLGGARPLAFVLLAFVLATAYLGLHRLFSHWVEVSSTGHRVQSWQLAWVLVSFATLFLLQSVVRARPDGAVARALYPWLYAGLYLDELFTRLTFRVWPPRLPRSTSDAGAVSPRSIHRGVS